MQEIKFGMLQNAKASEIKAAKAGTQGAQIGKAEDIFSQYKNYLSQVEAQQGGSTDGGNNNYETSVQEMENLINAKVEEFNNYYAIINESEGPTKKQPDAPNEDDKNKIPPKNFSGLMA